MLNASVPVRYRPAVRWIAVIVVSVLVGLIVGVVADNARAAEDLRIMFEVPE